MELIQLFLTLRTIKSHPEGITLDDLAEKLRQEFPNNEAVRHMLESRGGCGYLRENILGNLNCVSLEDGKYFFKGEYEPEDQLEVEALKLI